MSFRWLAAGTVSNRFQCITDCEFTDYRSWQRLQRPMLAPQTRQLRVLRQDRTLIDPGAQQADLFGRESLALQGHDFIGLQSSDEPQEPAFRALAWQNDFAVIAAFERALFGVEAQPAFLLLWPVAFKAVLCEDGLHLA